MDAGANPPTTMDAGASLPTTMDAGANPPTTMDAGANPPTTMDADANPPTTMDAGAHPPTSMYADVHPQISMDAGANPQTSTRASANQPRPFLQKQNTMEQMQMEGGAMPFFSTLCAVSCCCWWVPVFGLMAADNVLSTCTEPLQMWLQVFSLLIFVLPLVLVIITSVFAALKVRICFKLGHTVQSLTGTINLVWCCYGLSISNVQDPTTCYDAAAGGYNPVTMVHTFSIFFIVLTSIGILLLCCAIIAICGAVAGTAASENDLEASLQPRGPGVGLHAGSGISLNAGNGS